SRPETAGSMSPSTCRATSPHRRRPVRIDDAGPRTWLLAGVAGWALVAWLLAVAGMGGRVEPLPDDPTLLQPLPPVRPAPPPPLGSPDQSVHIDDRPLFSSNPTPQPFYLQAQ